MESTGGGDFLRPVSELKKRVVVLAQRNYGPQGFFPIVIIGISAELRNLRSYPFFGFSSGIFFGGLILIDQRCQASRADGALGHRARTRLVVDLDRDGRQTRRGCSRSCLTSIMRQDVRVKKESDRLLLERNMTHC